MSGIYGIIRYDAMPVTREMLAPVATSMSFRGPDGHGQWCADSAGLGHLMLHVTPESLVERLPASIRVAPHLVITADARIDNRDELFDALGVPTSGRSQTPDSSLILLAYERWGPGCVKRLLGDFAFAIWDSRERKLFCARDAFGCMPFVYHFDGKRFIFASDMKGVLAGLETPRLHKPLLAAHLHMKTYFAEKSLTFFEEIVKLQPGHSLTLASAGLEVSRYWSPEDAPEVRLAGTADYAEQLAHLFRQAVECRLRSAFPIGSHLSGGLDSSATCVVASRILRERGRELATFSWSPEPIVTLQPEGEYARIEALCRQERFSCEYLPVTKASLLAAFQRDFTVEPTAMMPREANVQARAEALHLRVILSGWGGDDAVTCPVNTSPAEFLAHNQWSEFRRAIRSRLDEPDSQASVFRKARRFGGLVRELALVNLPDSLYGFTRRNAFQEHKAQCAQAAFAGRYRQEVRNMRGPALRRLATARAYISLLLEDGHISKRIEQWAASGAQHRLVYRYPMLDKRLVEFALGIPSLQLPQTDRRRSLFRRALGDLMPQAVDWDLVKQEPATFSGLEREHIQAHSDWAVHLASEKAASAANRFVDPARIQRAVQSAVKSGRVRDLSGVKEAFGFYAIDGRFVV